MFRPNHEPARTIYDAFESEAEKRNGRSIGEMIVSERRAVLLAAIDWIIENGGNVPTMKDVERAEVYASGHTDFGAQWAYGVARVIKAKR